MKPLVNEIARSDASSYNKTQIQALDRTQPGLPMKKGRAGTMTHDYKRHGTTTLFAALDVLEGKVLGRCMQRHRHQEFVRFLNAIERDVQVGKLVHVILDNYATHKHPKVRQNGSPDTLASPSISLRLRARGRTPSRVSSAKLTRRRLKRGVFKWIVDLQTAVNRFITEADAQSEPFVWTKHPDTILAAVKRGRQTLEPIH